MQRISRSCLFALIVTLSVTPACLGQQIPGLNVGTKAPAFKLKDQQGKEVSLETLLKKGKVALVFHRSAEW
jgi:cytochrome oxidase Cu insertion factor (SCO1/SenC/PrrC family)